MSKTYFFIYIQEVVKFYEQTEDKVIEIPTAVKYSINDEELWTWFENNVGELEGNAVYFLSEELVSVPFQFQKTQETYSLNLLKATMKALFMDCTVEVFYGEESFLLPADGEEQIRLYLLHPSEAIDKLEDEFVEEEEEPEINLYTGEKSDLKRAFEGIYHSYHTNNESS